MPITHAVDAVLNHGADVDRAIAELFAHPCRMEAPLVNRVNGSSDWVR